MIDVYYVNVYYFLNKYWYGRCCKQRIYTQLTKPVYRIKVILKKRLTGY